MLSNEQNDEECDATDDDSSTEVGDIKKIAGIASACLASGSEDEED
jgi:hypothetical protein